MPSEKSKFDLLYGRKPVQLFLEKSPRRAFRLLLDRRLNPQQADKFQRLARGRSIEVRPMDRHRLDQMTDQAVHQGVALEAEPLRIRPATQLVDLCHRAKSDAGRISAAGAPSAGVSDAGRVGLLILDGVTDPQNFGAICRLADGFGLTAVVFEPKGSPPFGGAAYKASAGALDFVPLYGAPDLPGTVKTLRSHGLFVLGLDPAGGVTLSDLAAYPTPAGTDLRRIGIVLGSEDRGMRPGVKAQCHVVCAIPMKGRIGSLNVSSAASAVCFWWSELGQ